MNRDQLRKAFFENIPLEYRLDDDQWLPAVVSHIEESNPPRFTIRLLRPPLGHPGSFLVLLSGNDESDPRLRIKGSAS